MATDGKAEEKSMHSIEYWTMRPESTTQDTAMEMGRLCLNGECPIIIDSMSSCPVMELYQKSCADIREFDWIRWLKANQSQKKHA